MALSPYYGMFDPFSGLDPFAGLSDPFFSTVGFPTQTGGGGGRSRGVLDYPMVRMLGAFTVSSPAHCLPDTACPRRTFARLRTALRCMPTPPA